MDNFLKKLLSGPTITSRELTPQERRVAEAVEHYAAVIRVNEYLNPNHRPRLDNAAIEFADAMYEYTKARLIAEGKLNG